MKKGVSIEELICIDKLGAGLRKLHLRTILEIQIDVPDLEGIEHEAGDDRTFRSNRSTGSQEIVAVVNIVGIEGEKREMLPSQGRERRQKRLAGIEIGGGSFRIRWNAGIVPSRDLSGWRIGFSSTRAGGLLCPCRDD